MSDTRKYIVNIARNAVLEYLKNEKKFMCKMLLENTSKKEWSFGLKGGVGKYENYQWIEAQSKNSSERYWLCLFSNDYDEISYNYHTVIGEIQFWRGIIEHKYGENNDKKRFGPNKSETELFYPSLADKNKSKKIKLMENEKIKLMENEKVYNTGISVFDEEYDCNNIVEMFLDFIKNN